MGLIPSESTSFPDLLGRGLGASKKSKWRLPAEMPLPVSEPQVSKTEATPQPNISAEPPTPAETSAPLLAPSVDPVTEVALLVEPAVPEPLPAHVPSPEEKEAEAPTHAPIPIVRIPRSIADRARDLNPDLPAPASTDSIIQEGPMMDRAPNLPPLRPRPRLRPRPTLQPRFETEEPAMDSVEPAAEHTSETQTGVPVAVAPQYAALQADAAAAGHPEEFGFLESTAATSMIRQRRRARLLRLLLWELFALAVTGVAIKVSLSYRSPNDAVALVAKAVTIGLAIAAVVLPVVFYGLPEKMPAPSDR
jgi:hypothetical protein